jgi:hypothetical protein
MKMKQSRFQIQSIEQKRRKKKRKERITSKLIKRITLIKEIQMRRNKSNTHHL